MSIYQDILDQLQPLQPLPTALSPCIRPFPDCKVIMFDIYGTLLISASGDIGHQEMGVEAMDQALRQLTALASAIDPEQALMRYKHHIEQAHANLKQRGVVYPEIDILTQVASY